MNGPPPSVAGFARASYRGISPYAPDRSLCRIDLSDNTNLWGAPPAAMRELECARADTVTRYPQVYASSLKEALSAYVGVPPEMLVTGCGSDDVLDAAIRAFGEPGRGDRVAFPDPSFPMIPLFARMNGLHPVAVPLTPSYDVDVDAMVDARARILYLCSPNNPTGTLVSLPAIEAIVNRASNGEVVIVDEAYAEYAGVNVLHLLAGSDRLLVTRTMSKAFGLAGLRVGYAAGSPALIAEIEKSRGPYKVNGVAARAACAALRDDLKWVREHVVIAVDHRERLTDDLQRRGLSPIRSQANFVLVPIRDAGSVARKMRARGVAVRSFESLPPVSEALVKSGGGALRFTVGPWEQVEQALAVFDEASAACA